MAGSGSVLDRYQEQFRRSSGSAGSKSPAWLAELREKAMSRFAQLGFPSTHEEGWRFTNVQPIAETPFDLPAPSANGVSPADLDRILEAAPGLARLVFVDGRWSAALSHPGTMPAGVRLETFSSGVAATTELVREHLGRYARCDDNGFTALSTAFVGDGALVYVPPGTTSDRPLQIVFVARGSENRVSYPRCLVVVDRNAQAVVQELFVSNAHGKHFTNAVTELVVGEGARLDHCRIQMESEAGYHVATTQSHQARDSVLESCSVAFGAGLSRHDIGAVLGGSGAFLTLNGLSVLAGRQHGDHHTVIDHAQPHCESHELFNGVFDDHARGVFTGRIVVRPGAQRTDSKQTNNNLLLSSDARADSQPQLEIYADDVKCTHGATLGPLDDASMFYLRSRGIDAPAARRLLTYGFGADVVGRVRNAVVRAHLDRVLTERLRRLTASGAVS